MKPESIFDYKDYRSYLNHALLSRAEVEKGQKLKLANSIQCNPAYLTRILDGRSNLSLEQAQGTNEFLGHTDTESRYFLNLVSFERSGTKNLKQYFQNEIKKTRDERLVLKNRIQEYRTLNEVDQAQYYSSWHYAAIHMAIALEQIKTKEQLAKTLNLSLDVVGKALEFLTSVGILTSKKGHYSRGETQIFLGTDSPFISKHHTNWRVKALQSLDSNNANNFHYSGVLTCSAEDLAKLKDVMIKTVQEMRSVAKASPADENLLAYTLDFFDLIDAR